MEEKLNKMNINMKDINNYNSLALAYMGDAIYEVYIRKYLLSNNIVKVKELQQEATKYVSARGQASFLYAMLDKNFFNEAELEIILRARNHKSRSPKSTDIVTYKYSTALEAIIGYLYLNDNIKRIDQIMKEIIGE